jgi:hypothetical protein
MFDETSGSEHRAWASVNAYFRFALSFQFSINVVDLL